jgi:hypothetical protein
MGSRRTGEIPRDCAKVGESGFLLTTKVRIKQNQLFRALATALGCPISDTLFVSDMGDHNCMHRDPLNPSHPLLDLGRARLQAVPLAMLGLRGFSP